MKRRQYIFSFLLFAYMAMVAASVIPHHHHGNGIICMKDDIAADECCGENQQQPHHQHHHQHGNDLCCSDNCLAFFDTPPTQQDAQQAVQPHFQHVTILYTEPLLRLLFRQEEKNTDRNRIYIELLHGAYYTRAVGLRAPPSLLS